MKNKKIFLTIALFMVIISTGGVIYLALQFKEFENSIINVYFGVLTIIIPIFWSSYSKKFETENANNIKKRYKSGYAAITFLILSFIYILIVLLQQWNIIWLIIGIIVFIGSAFWSFILGIRSKLSLSGQENYSVEPENFWRVIWNMLPVHFGYEKNPILNVLIIHSKEGGNQAKQMQQRYEQSKDELWIDHHLCVDNNKKQLVNKLTAINYIGIHLIYTEDIKSEMSWVRELCYEWANNNKSKPIVYTNCTDEDQPLNYGTSNKDSDGILRLFQRTHTLSESWQEQATIQHKFFKWLFVTSIAILIGFNLLFFFNRKKNEEQINKEQIVLVGGGTVKEFIEKKIDSTKFSTDNLLFVPMPTTLGCEQLGDKGFTKRLQGKVIIMSSQRQKNDSVFRLFDNSTIKHILEIYLCQDNFYVRSEGIEWFNEEKGIDLKTLKEKIETSNVEKVFHTNINSGTYNFYKESIDAAKEKKKSEVYYAGKETKTSFAGKKNYLILTRSFYDPIPSSNNTTKKINILTEEGGLAEGELFLYIPITDFEITDNSPYQIPSHIQKFLNSINVKEFPTRIEVNQHGKTIIPDDSYMIRKEKIKTEGESK